MRALIPKDALRELLRDFQLDGAALPGPANGQPTLCESSTGPSPPEQFGECPLTAREVEFLNAAGQGLTTRELAKKLGLAPTTVTNMVSAVNHKLGTRDRLEAAATAAAAGWVDAPSVAAPDRPTARPVARHRSDPRREEKSNGQAAIDHDPRAETTKSPGENGGVTDREREILRGLATHRTKQQLAAQLGMEPPALRGELRALFRKLNVPDRHAAVRRARDQGLL